VLASRPDALIARCGLIVGPHENVGRLPLWLLRLSRGGRVPAPGPIDRPLQMIDARDLALWILTATDAGITGIFDTVSRPGHTTIGELLDAVHEATQRRAALVWMSPDQIDEAGVEPWTDLPLWLPPPQSTSSARYSTATHRRR
jgi:2'-hydroxyisoflavone reductase